MILDLLCRAVIGCGTLLLAPLGALIDAEAAWTDWTLDNPEKKP